ncbi:hypothetical protein FNF29_06180 [Cafeteria roenbergensis]|uniref:Amino acid permease/ SLC12A domain-containing protein n=1 Tax=Cafeteria roenbergensis TaxID=33653 RepID=A0A5A8DBZ4_CAFRO|nr:hypothetical protein FNF29_06180 [Cafeteria roenbergensis]KAA0163043.1 hypothetical protein FNF28_04433 [Cafeteria roenbergensis]|eukprot:KAA0149092.1 hypothetical protein FNF29_06180 [Cafeteria roenbergensis]
MAAISAPSLEPASVDSTPPAPEASRLPSSRRKDDSDRPEAERSLSVVGLAFVTYLAVCGGPFGIETAVGAAGTLPTIIAVAALAVLWELPQALMTAELSTVFPSNAGYIGWVSRGLGPFWGFLNAGNSLASNLFDLPLYPVLIADYAVQVFDADKGGVLEWSIKGVSLLIVIVLNVLGIDVVATSSVFFTLIIVAPFIVQLFMVEYKPENWLYVAPEIEWVPFLSATLWAVQGFDSMGCVAGEVKDAHRTYPLGVSLATTLITANYLLPVMVGVSVQGDFSQWRADDDGITDGSAAINLATVGKAIAPWMGIWVLVSATIANLAEFSAIMSTSSRALQHVADYGMLPAGIACSHATRKTPIVAILLQSAIVLGLMFFDFSQLVTLDTLFNNVSLLLEVAAFLHLKHVYPNLPRPYAVPWGVWGAWLVSIPKIAVILFAIGALGFTESSWPQLVGAVVVNIVFAIGGYYWLHFTEGGRAWKEDSSGPEGTSLLDGGAAAGAARPGSTFDSGASAFAIDEDADIVTSAKPSAAGSLKRTSAEDVVTHRRHRGAGSSGEPDLLAGEEHLMSPSRSSSTSPPGGRRGRAGDSDSDSDGGVSLPAWHGAPADGRAPASPHGRGAAAAAGGRGGVAGSDARTSRRPASPL